MNIKYLKRLLLFFLMFFVYNCTFKENDVISLKYVNKENMDTMSVIITEHSNTEKRVFSEEYIIPGTYIIFDKQIKDTLKYIDNFFYIKNIGLYRKLNSITNYYIPDVIGHFKDFLWISIDIYNGKNDTITTYYDRPFGKKNFDDIPDVLPEFRVTLIEMNFNVLYNDTLRTFLFQNTNYSGSAEIKTYDSNFNLITYIYSDAKNNYNEYEILKNDYKRLKDFRSKYKKIFYD